jgi:hypothetical protein
VHVSHSGVHYVSRDIFHNVHVQGQTSPVNANVLCGVVDFQGHSVASVSICEAL